MKKPIEVKTFVELDVKNIMQRFGDTLYSVNKSSARRGKNLASGMFASQYQGVAPHRHVERVLRSFKATESLYGKKGGWIFGPMASPGFPWEETVGGRSFFFEYGRMPAGMGRGSVGRAAYKRAGGNIDAEGQRARPYMRPTKEMLIPIHQKSMEKASSRLVKTLNKKYTSGRASWKGRFTRTYTN